MPPELDMSSRGPTGAGPLSGSRARQKPPPQGRIRQGPCFRGRGESDDPALSSAGSVSTRTNLSSLVVVIFISDSRRSNNPNWKGERKQESTAPEDARRREEAGPPATRSTMAMATTTDRTRRARGTKARRRKEYCQCIDAVVLERNIAAAHIWGFLSKFA